MTGGTDTQRLLMIAYHYPPAHGSSGLQRTLCFSRYLHEHGWRSTVLSAHPRAYPATSDAQLGDIHPETTVRRAFALDTARHLAVGGRYPGFLALPDRWSTWWAGAVPKGLGLIRRHGIRVLWSTYPVATALLIGLTLHRLTGLPWIADLRDSMTEEDYPPDPRVRRMYRWIERQAIERARYCVFTTPGTVALYAERYPHVDRERLVCIPNGYDEEIFQRVESAPVAAAGCGSPRPGPVTLLHSGLIYPWERDPTALFDAVASLAQAQCIRPGELRIVLRATGHDARYRPMLAERGIEAFVELAPSVDYATALREMLDVDGLLVMQGASCNHQVPAKIYEYLRAGRPVLALADPAGDTAGVLRDCGVEAIVPLDDAAAIADALRGFVIAIRDGDAKCPDADLVPRYSRRSQTADLAGLLARCR